MVARLTLGAPGVYPLPAESVRALTGVRMDVCAFVGVAPRGPARTPWADPLCAEGMGKSTPVQRSVPVAVGNWDEYRRLFGSFEGPGLLPYAVAAFFEQGGQRAYVVRIVHAYDDHRDDEGVSRFKLSGIAADTTGDVLVLARNEGSWGDALQATLSFSTRPLAVITPTPADLVVDSRESLPVGSLLRLTQPDGTRALRFVTLSRERALPDRPGSERVVTFADPVSGTPTRAEVVEGNLEVIDRDPLMERRELHQHLGLSSNHPRWLAAVLRDESALLWPDQGWATGSLSPQDATLPAAWTKLIGNGVDREADITPEDFFDSAWTLGDDCPGGGVNAVLAAEDVALLVVPDLYSPRPLPEIHDVSDPLSPPPPTFRVCVKPPTAPTQAHEIPELAGLRLDAEQPDDLDRIVRYQGRLVQLAQATRAFTVLLDVPPRLGQNQILVWRSRFDSAFAASYHPWLRVARTDDKRDQLVALNPSAVAAGIIARKELQQGLPFGPANELATGVLDVLDAVSPARHDVLHPAGIDIFLKERDGVRLTGARTLSRDPVYRQLNVRRVLTMLELTLARGMAWTVFEPNDERLWATLRQQLLTLLRRLAAAGAFTGATDEESFFVRCDATLNPPVSIAQGRLLLEIGVALAEPVEFILLRVSRDGDGTLRVESSRAA